MLDFCHASGIRASAKRLRGTDQRVLIVDGFLRNPDEVRAAALEMTYSADVPAYPGVTAAPGWARQTFAAALSGLVQRPVAREQISLRLSMVTKRGEELEPWQCVPHCDPADLAGVVYLNPPEQCRGGTAFYRHRESGLVQVPGHPDARTLLFMVRSGIGTRDELLHRLMAPPAKSKGYISESTADWELIDLVEMRYNRFVLYNGRLFHSGYMRDGDFGETKSERRLTLNFFVEGEQALHSH